MFTDMVGYTAGAQADESATLALRKEQENLIRPVLAAHQGRRVKSTGDGFLLEFESALKATECALNIQRRIHERNARAEVKPIRLRIGIHLGDVEEQGTDIFGDAVNIAARIEPVAEPGGICLTGAVYEQIRNKIPAKLEKLPPTTLKGVNLPVDIYRVELPWTDRPPAPEFSKSSGLAVLPFTSISPEPKDEYFADGLTEELITVLSHLPELRVIARTSIMQYKATNKPVSQIGSELHVASVLEGSVRKAGNHLRVTAQLIDVGSEGHHWASTYDREMDDIFAVQADLAKEVAEALKIELRPVEVARLAAKPPIRPDSYLAYVRGRTLMHDWAIAARIAAKEQFELAISLDPKNAAAHAGLADISHWIGWSELGLSRKKWNETVRQLVARAIELDPDLGEAHTSLANILWDDFDYAQAEKEIKRAISLNPNDAPAHHTYAAMLQDQGRAEEALAELALAEAVDPYSVLQLHNTADLLIWLRRFDQAFVKIQKLRELDPKGQLPHGTLAGYYLARSDREACLREVQKFIELEPDPRAKAIEIAWSHALAGETKAARTILEHDASLPVAPHTGEYAAMAHAELGDLDGCFRELERMRKSHFLAFQRWRLDPRYGHIRSDPRFHALMRKMNLV